MFRSSLLYTPSRRSSGSNERNILGPSNDIALNLTYFQRLLGLSSTEKTAYDIICPYNIRRIVYVALWQQPKRQNNHVIKSESTGPSSN